VRSTSWAPHLDVTAMSRLASARLKNKIEHHGKGRKVQEVPMTSDVIEQRLSSGDAVRVCSITISQHGMNPAVLALPEPEREVLRLRGMNLSFSEIAKMMRITKMQAFEMHRIAAAKIRFLATFRELLLMDFAAFSAFLGGVRCECCPYL